jgi:TatD DNase family protein
LHVRDAFEDAFAMLAGFKGAAVFHCFSGDVTEAEKICEMNQYISMTGTLTFGHRKNKNQKAARVLEAIPLEKLMLETDCPWMAPEPQRGKRNEPSFVPYIAQVAAELKQISLVDFACQTTKNAEKFFSLEDTWKLPASS